MRDPRTSSGLPRRDAAGAAAEPSGDALAFVPGTERRGSAGPRAVCDMLQRLVPKPARRQAALTASLMLDWHLIVGPELAAVSEPIRLVASRTGSGGTLHVRVLPAAAVELQHAQPVVLERIARHLGVPVADRIRLIQGVPQACRRPVTPRPSVSVDHATRAEIAQSVAGLPQELAEALEALGTAVAAATPPRRRIT